MRKKHIFLALALLSFFILVFARVGEKSWVEQADCVGCGDCVRVCPVDAVKIVDGRAAIDPELCINCGFCVKSCTYQAVRSAK